jgi:iron-sulfur cluster repair protein YtfE (RIC family)
LSIIIFPPEWAGYLALKWKGMSMKHRDKKLQEEMEPADLCKYLEKECHEEIHSSVKKITHCFSEEPFQLQNESAEELLQLLFSKLSDEVQHVFLKESGIVFPLIKKSNTEAALEPRIADSIQLTQKMILNLLIKIRQLLNDYIPKPGSGKKWKACLNELFLLENKIHYWIHIEQSVLYPAITRKKDIEV